MASEARDLQTTCRAVTPSVLPVHRFLASAPPMASDLLRLLHGISGGAQEGQAASLSIKHSRFKIRGLSRRPDLDPSPFTAYELFLNPPLKRAHLHVMEQALLVT